MKIENKQKSDLRRSIHPVRTPIHAGPGLHPVWERPVPERPLSVSRTTFASAAECWPSATPGAPNGVETHADEQDPQQQPS